MTLLDRALPTQLSGADGKSGEIDIRSLTNEQLIEFRKRLRVEPMPKPNWLSGNFRFANVRFSDRYWG